jgi:hypothetical protein
MSQAVEITFDDIKRELQARIRHLVRELAPDGQFAGGYYMPRNPRREDRHAGSFWIRISGTAIGAWREEATGEKGDVIDLVTYLKGLADRRATREWCMSWLGWTRGVDRQKLETARKASVYKQLQDEREEKEAAEKKARQAASVFFKADKLAAGDRVHVYLASRGIDLGRLKRLPGALRFLASAQHVDLDGVITEWPVMIAGMSNSAGQVVAVHRTYLDTASAGKAPVEPQKKIWPAFKGCVIRIAKGAGNHSPEEAARRGIKAPLILTEGIEDALAVAISMPDMRIWAAASLANMANIPKLPCISELIVVADNDTKIQAQRGLDRVLHQLRKRQFALRVTKSWTGKDANDLLKGTGA